jgi:hypothetical protein
LIFRNADIIAIDIFAALHLPLPFSLIFADYSFRSFFSIFTAFAPMRHMPTFILLLFSSLITYFTFHYFIEAIAIDRCITPLMLTP